MLLSGSLSTTLYFFKDSTYLFLERKGREKEKEANSDWMLLLHAPPRDQTYNPGMTGNEISDLFAGQCPNNCATLVKCGILCPVELSQPPWVRMSHPGHNLLFQRKRRWQFPLVENAPSPSPKRLLLGLVFARVYSMHANLINQCPEAIVIENQYYLQITIERPQRSASGQGLLDMLKPEGC